MTALAVIATLLWLAFMFAFIGTTGKRDQQVTQLRQVVSRISRETQDWAEGRKDAESALRAINGAATAEIRGWPARKIHPWTP
jgi:hypothetical protein